MAPGWQLGSNGRTDRTGGDDLGRRDVEQQPLRGAGDVQLGSLKLNLRAREGRRLPLRLSTLPLLPRLNPGPYIGSGYAAVRSWWLDALLPSIRWNH